MTATLIQEIQPTPVACCTPVADPGITDEQATTLAAVFKALADPSRLRIVNLLANAPASLCVCDFVPHLGLSQGDGQLSFEEAARGRASRARTTWHLGLLLTQPCGS